MPQEDSYGPDQVEAEERFLALLESRQPDAEATRRLEAFAQARAVHTTPSLVANVIVEPIRSGRCEHLPSRFWFIAADIFYGADRHADCRFALEQAFGRGSQDDLDDTGHGYYVLGLVEASQHDWRRAVAAWEMCLKLLPANDARETALLTLLGEGWEALGCLDRASARFMAALKLAARRGDIARECEALFQLARHARDRGWADQAAVYFKQALDRSREEGYPPGESTAEIGMASVYMDLGEVAAARDSVESGLSKARELEDRLLQASALASVAELENREGNVTRARAALEEAIFHAQGANAHALLAAFYHSLAMLHEASGKKTLALTTYEKALRERRRAGDSAGLGATLNNLASLHVELGDRAAARRLYREALVALGECGHERKETDVVIENIKKLDAGSHEPGAGDRAEATGSRPDHTPEAELFGAEMDDASSETEMPWFERPLRPPIPFPGRSDRSE